MFVPDLSHDASSDAIERLSERQRTCLGLAADGLTSAAIAERLGLSPRTVDEHLLLACRALGVRTRVQAVARCAAAARRRSEPRSFHDQTRQFRGAVPPGRGGRAGRFS